MQFDQEKTSRCNGGYQRTNARSFLLLIVTIIIRQVIFISFVIQNKYNIMNSHESWTISKAKKKEFGNRYSFFRQETNIDEKPRRPLQLPKIPITRQR